MRDDFADLKTSRTLTLLAKALQTVGNIGSTIGSGKVKKKKKKKKKKEKKARKQ